MSKSKVVVQSIASATGAVCEGVMLPIGKTETPTIHYVTAQGFADFFTETAKASPRFLSMIQACLADEFEHVVKVMDKAVSDLPHNTPKEKNKVSADQHTAYTVASSRRTEFRWIFGACRASEEYRENVLSNEYGKDILLTEAKRYLAEFNLDWKGENQTAKDAERAKAAEVSATKASDKLASDMALKGMAITDEQKQALKQAMLDAPLAAQVEKRLEKMADKAKLEAQGLLKYYNQDLAAAISHAKAILEALTSKQPA